MACYLLKNGYTREEVNARLGHTPSSSEIDKYINFLAIDKSKPQKKVYESNLRKVEEELKKSKEREKLFNQKLDSLRKHLLQQADGDKQTEQAVNIIFE